MMYGQFSLYANVRQIVRQLLQRLWYTYGQLAFLQQIVSFALVYLSSSMGTYGLHIRKIPTMKSISGVKAENGVSSKPSEEVKAESEKIDFSNVKIEPLFEEEVDFDTFSKSDFRAVKVKECVAVPKSKKLLQFTLDDGTGTDRTILSGIHAYYEPEELVGKTLIAITNLPPRKMMGIESCGMLLSAVNNLKDSEDEELHLLMVDDHIPAGAKLY